MKAAKTGTQRGAAFALAAALALSFALLALFGCGAKDGMEPDDAALRFIELLNGGDYEAAYALLTGAAKEAISEEEFVQKYGGIFSGLTVREVIIGENSFTQSAMYATFAYTATYRTAAYGDITKNFSMPLHSEGGAWRIEWTPSLIFPEMTWGDSVYARVIKAKRGEIFGSDGTLLAGNIPGSTAYADRAKIGDENSFCAAAAQILGMTAEEVQKCFDATTAGIVAVKAWRSGELPEETRQSWLSLAGAGVDDASFTVFRTYPLGEAFFHLIGYVGKITKEEMDAFSGTEKEKLYDGDSFIGKTGLELSCEDELRGTDGYEVYVSGENGKINIIPTVKAADGNDLWLTIDARDQQAAYDLLANYLMDEQGGSIIQIDPQTGAVQVMVSYPRRTRTPSSPGFPRNITIICFRTRHTSRCSTAASPAGTRRGPSSSPLPPWPPWKAGRSPKIPYSPIRFRIINGGRTDRLGVSRDHPRQEPGDSCNLYNSIIYSDNIYFAWAAMELGQEKFFDFFENRLGWGESVPFELPVAKAQIKKEKTEFNIKYLADSGYGQGEMLITPLQAALLYCSLSNADGAMYAPYVIEKRCNGEGSKYVAKQSAEPVLWMNANYHSGVRGAIEQALSDVTTVGTASSLKPPYKMAGKTGTRKSAAKRTGKSAGWRFTGTKRRRIPCWWSRWTRRKAIARSSCKSRGIFCATKCRRTRTTRRPLRKIKG